MKTNKKWLLAGLFSICIMASAGTYAQPDLTPEQRADRRVQKMDEELDLSPEQEMKLKEIYTDAARKHPKPGKGATQAEYKEFKKNRVDTHKKVKAVLTPDQAAKYEKFRDERMVEMQEKHMEKRLDMMKTELGLSADQEGKIRKHMEDHITALEDAQAHWARKTDAERDKEIKSLKKDLNKNIRSELNPAQLEKLKEMKKAKKGKRK